MVFEMAKHSLAPQEWEVFRALGVLGAVTSLDGALVLDLPYHSVRARLSALESAGLVRRTSPARGATYEIPDAVDSSAP